MTTKSTKSKSKSNTTTKSKPKQKQLEPEQYKPSVYIENKQIPKNIKQSKIGDTVTITMQAKIVSKTKRESVNNKVSDEMCLEIQRLK